MLLYKSHARCSQHQPRGFIVTTDGMMLPGIVEQCRLLDCAPASFGHVHKYNSVCSADLANVVVVLRILDCPGESSGESSPLCPSAFSAGRMEWLEDAAIQPHLAS